MSGKSANFIAAGTYRLGPIPSGPAVFDKKGSVKINSFTNLIKNVACPNHVILIGSVFSLNCLSVFLCVSTWFEGILSGISF